MGDEADAMWDAEMIDEGREQFSWNDCIHKWAPVDFDLGGNRTAMRCKKCQCPGERDDNTSEIYWPTT